MTYVVLVLHDLMVMQIQACGQCTEERRICYDRMGPGNPFAGKCYDNVVILKFRRHRVIGCSAPEVLEGQIVDVKGIN